MNYTTIAPDTILEKTIAALLPRNIEASVVSNKEEALEKVKSLIPDAASVMTGASVTLEQMGFVDFLKSGKHPWNNLKDAILAEQDTAKQSRLRKEATLADYFLGSVHAVTEEGELLIASNTGSQLPAYASGASNVIWVVGAQKIVPTLADAFTRLENHVLPLENKHMQDLYGRPSNISKVLIFKKEIQPKRVRIVFVKEVLGF